MDVEKMPYPEKSVSLEIKKLFICMTHFIMKKYKKAFLNRVPTNNEKTEKQTINILFNDIVKKDKKYIKEEILLQKMNCSDGKLKKAYETLEKQR